LSKQSLDTILFTLHYETEVMTVFVGYSAIYSRCHCNVSRRHMLPSALIMQANGDAEM